LVVCGHLDQARSAPPDRSISVTARVPEVRQRVRTRFQLTSSLLSVHDLM